MVLQSGLVTLDLALGLGLILLVEIGLVLRVWFGDFLPLGSASSSGWVVDDSEEKSPFPVSEGPC